MTKMVFCKKYKKYLEGLDDIQYPGEVGQRIHKEISKQAWQDWMSRQTILINEYALNVLDKESRDFLEKNMIEYLFGE